MDQVQTSVPPPAPPAAPVEVLLAGRALRFASGDHPDLIAGYEDHLEGEAWKTLRRARKHLDLLEFAEQSDGTRRDLEAGVFRYGAPAYFASLRSRANQKQFVLLAAQILDPSVAAADVDALYDDPAAYVALMDQQDRLLVGDRAAASARAAAAKAGIAVG